MYKKAFTSICLILLLLLSSCNTAGNNSSSKSSISPISSNSILNRYYWGMSKESAKEVSSDYTPSKSFSETDSTLYYEVTNSDHPLVKACIEGQTTPLIGLVFKSNKLFMIVFGGEEEIEALPAGETNRKNELFAQLEKSLNDEFGNPIYYEDRIGSDYLMPGITNVYYSNNETIELTTVQFSHITYTKREIGSIPDGMDHQVYEYGISALNTVDDFLNNRIDNDFAANKLERIETKIREICEQNDLNYSNNEIIAMDISMLWIKVFSLNDNNFEVYYARNKLAIALNELPINKTNKQ